MVVRVLSIACLHTVLSGVCECCENRRGEGRTHEPEVTKEFCRNSRFLRPIYTGLCEHR